MELWCLEPHVFVMRSGRFCWRQGQAGAVALQGYACFGRGYVNEARRQYGEDSERERECREARDGTARPWQDAGGGSEAAIERGAVAQGQCNKTT